MLSNQLFSRFTAPLILLSLILLHIGLALTYNDGHFVYALDDPYIHLDLADMLYQHGLYGVNMREYAAPSSSILWPFLLVPFFILGSIAVYAPFILALASSCAAVMVIEALAKRLSPQLKNNHRLILVCLAAMTINLPAMPLMGMEHATQILLVLLTVLGTLEALEGDAPPRWLWLVLIISPLIRYENLFPSLGALGI